MPSREAALPVCRLCRAACRAGYSLIASIVPCGGASVKLRRKARSSDAVGLQYILDSEKKKDEGFAQIGYCEFNKSNKDRKEVQIPHDNCNTGHEVQAIPNVLREEIWRSTSVAEI